MLESEKNIDFSEVDLINIEKDIAIKDFIIKSAIHLADLEYENSLNTKDTYISKNRLKEKYIKQLEELWL